MASKRGKGGERTKPTGPVTKADIEHKLRQLSGGLEEGADKSRRIGPWVIGAFAGIAIVYRLGLILGARKAPQLEIRRIIPSG
jgi:hypothetical protein